MRIFVAGASGVLGVRLVPLLVAAGHEVAGLTRSPTKAGLLRELGAQPVVCDVYDASALRDAVVDFGPELVVHELTDLPDDPDEIGDGTANARIRREGTRNLLAAAQAAGAPRFLAQSVAWELRGSGAAAKDALEGAVLDFGGVVLRYGQFYGPGTYHPKPPDPPRIQIDDAARRTAELLEAPTGIVEVVETIP
jgi:nucleoside-diphosphate-sugar epimerase